VAGEVGISVVTREIFMCGLWLDLLSALAFSLKKLLASKLYQQKVSTNIM
jgi:hypothetical protein